jgi:TRAP-type C4-dicarboxylate transport system substrate-binding protein
LRRVLVAAAALAAVAVGIPAHAQQATQLKFAFMPPPQSPYVAQAIGPWIEQVNSLSRGAVEAKLYPGPQLANYANVLDRLTNGVVEIGYGIFGNLGNQFPKANVSVLPFESEDAETPSVVMWRLYKQGLIADGMDVVHPLALFVFPYSGLHAAKSVRTLDDMQGVKVGVFARQLGDMTQLLGGTPVSMQPTDVYQAMSRGTIAATLIGWAGVPTFKLQEVAPFHVDAPLGNSSGFIFMNKDVYAKLPAAGRAAIDAESYEKLSRAMGASGDRQALGARGRTAATKGQSVYRLAQDEAEKWRERLKPINDEWVKNTPNGEAILAAYREELQKVRESR